MPRWRRLPPLVLACALAFGCGSGQVNDARPSAALASSREAQLEFRSLHQRWLVGSDEERALLERDLRGFIGRHGGDPRARLARLYLAWIALGRGDLARARQLVAEVERGPSGSADDFARVAHAAILLREGRPGEALDLLEPLDGKIVDAEERLLFSEQRVLSALAARRHGPAVTYMTKWMAEAPPEDREAVGTRISKLLPEVSLDSLEKSLQALDREAQTGAAASRETARDFLRKSIRDRLVAVALENDDAALARRLIESGPASLRRGERGDALTRLAYSGVVVPRVAGRAIGFVLDLGSSLARTRSAEVVLGISRALGLPERDSDPSAVRLITAEDAGGEGGMSHALASLAGEGAAVLIAGVQPDGARAAKLYADDSAIPVIVISPLEELDPAGFAFSVAVDEAAQDALLTDELARRGTTRIARVGSGGVACDGSGGAGPKRFPVELWKRDRIEALVLASDAICARRAVSETTQAGLSPLFAFGLEAADVARALGAAHERIALSAGHYPFHSTKAASPELARWRKRSGKPPSWYAALGHDAAALASAAVADFALERVDDARAVSELHRRARGKLAAARAELWTSDRQGFEGGRRLARTLSIAAGPKDGSN